MYYGPGDPMFDRFIAKEVRTPGGLERLLDRLYPPLEPETSPSDLPSQAAHPHEEAQAEALEFQPLAS